jgi:sugar phosphate permease
VNLLFLPERSPTRATPGEPASAGGLSATNNNNVLHSPVLWSLSSAYFCLKLIRYSILFWLPYYLNTVLGYTKAQAGYQSVSFEVGGIAGSIVIGYISDRYFPGRRRYVASFMVAALAGALLLYTRLAPISVLLNFCGMALIGFCLFGPDTLISGAAAQDIGGKHDVAKAAGFINGFGSTGAIFQGLVTSGVSAKFGWDALFYVFVVLALLSSVALLIGRRPATEGT